TSWRCTPRIATKKLSESRERYNAWGQTGTDMNVIRLRRIFWRGSTFVQQGGAQHGTGLVHQLELLGSPFLDARLDTAGPMRVYFQTRQVLSWIGLTQPTQRIHETDPLGLHTLPSRRLTHYPTHQVVRHHEHRQFLQHPVPRLTTQHVHLHCLL